MDLCNSKITVHLLVKQIHFPSTIYEKAICPYNWCPQHSIIRTKCHIAVGWMYLLIVAACSIPPSSEVQPYIQKSRDSDFSRHATSAIIIDSFAKTTLLAAFVCHLTLQIGDSSLRDGGSVKTSHWIIWWLISCRHVCVLIDEHAGNQATPQYCTNS